MQYLYILKGEKKLNGHLLSPAILQILQSCCARQMCEMYSLPAYIKRALLKYVENIHLSIWTTRELFCMEIHNNDIQTIS